jgi:hypothetical protein
MNHRTADDRPRAVWRGHFESPHECLDASWPLMVAIEARPTSGFFFIKSQRPVTA